MWKISIFLVIVNLGWWYMHTLVIPKRHSYDDRSRKIEQQIWYWEILTLYCQERHKFDSKWMKTYYYCMYSWLQSPSFGIQHISAKILLSLTFFLFFCQRHLEKKLWHLSCKQYLTTLAAWLHFELTEVKNDRRLYVCCNCKVNLNL